jgi:hypothetical protein
MPTDHPGLVAELEKEGYELDLAEYTPPTPEEHASNSAERNEDLVSEQSERSKSLSTEENASARSSTTYVSTSPQHAPRSAWHRGFRRSSKAKPKER